jgi:hypothetical protein
MQDNTIAPQTEAGPSRQAEKEARSLFLVPYCYLKPRFFQALPWLA